MALLICGATLLLLQPAEVRADSLVFEPAAEAKLVTAAVAVGRERWVGTYFVHKRPKDGVVKALVPMGADGFQVVHSTGLATLSKTRPKVSTLKHSPCERQKREKRRSFPTSGTHFDAKVIPPAPASSLQPGFEVYVGQAALARLSSPPAELVEALKKKRVKVVEFDLTGLPTSFAFRYSVKGNRPEWWLLGQEGTMHVLAPSFAFSTPKVVLAPTNVDVAPPFQKDVPGVMASVNQAMATAFPGAVLTEFAQGSARLRVTEDDLAALGVDLLAGEHHGGEWVVSRLRKLPGGYRARFQLQAMAPVRGGFEHWSKGDLNPPRDAGTNEFQVRYTVRDFPDAAPCEAAKATRFVEQKSLSTDVSTPIDAALNDMVRTPIVALGVTPSDPLSKYLASKPVKKAEAKPLPPAQAEAPAPAPVAAQPVEHEDGCCACSIASGPSPRERAAWLIGLASLILLFVRQR